MSTNDGGPAPKCSWCDDNAHIKQGHIWLCAIHYRISTMRTKAKQGGKKVPTRHEIESMIPTPFVCIGCGRTMTWIRGENASIQVTLQHDRSGAIRLLCLGCNTRHSIHPDDSFYDIRPGYKLCPDCHDVLPISSFCIDRSRPIGRKSYCRVCASHRNKQWRYEQADAMLTERERKE